MYLSFSVPDIHYCLVYQLISGVFVCFVFVFEMTLKRRKEIIFEMLSRFDERYKAFLI